MRTTDLVAEVAAAWVDGSVEARPEDRSDLRSLLRRPDAEPPDYDRVHASFAAEFLLVNFHKCVRALTEARPEPAATVVDLGCGSGAASAAALAYLAEAGLEEVRVHLLDRSERQLQHAESLVREVAATLGKERRFDVEVVPALGDWPTERPAQWRGPAMVLASHVLTENRAHAWDFLNRAVALAGPRGSVTVVERADDGVWPALDKLVGESVLVRRFGQGDVRAATADGEDRTWATRWLTFEPGPHAGCEEAVRGYLTAWRKRDPDLLEKVFTEGARYRDKPFHPPIEGLTGIQEYWRSHVASQRAVSVRVDSIAYRPDAAHLEWTAFLDEGGDDVKRVYGFMVIEVDASGKIRELRECYRSQREARDAAV
ncbi:nuclear transport factor 2 family protein [Actinoplanes sp. M2I2]|uniref:nuclear transport factor 2 family protein n=1 Tax=Actinoplanes sp. M2I2 TaxID=1734444 RepID=UPI0020219633|nr:nuclear transport factor 2 family protein [Actinoplanes sp. M2I2]